MAVSDSPPIGLRHPTVTPDPRGATETVSERCECNDCEYTVEVADGMPQTCPECGGALTLVTSE